MGAGNSIMTRGGNFCGAQLTRPDVFLFSLSRSHRLEGDFEVVFFDLH